MLVMFLALLKIRLVYAYMHIYSYYKNTTTYICKICADVYIYISGAL